MCSAKLSQLKGIDDDDGCGDGGSHYLLVDANFASNARTAPTDFKPYPFRYHDVLEVEITALTNEGDGIGRVEVSSDAGISKKWVVMVPQALPGELVEVKIYKNFASYSRGSLVRVITPSSARREATCALFGVCGGCQYQHLAYDEQLRWKATQTRDLLVRITGLEPEVAEALVLPTVASPHEYNYRTKLTPRYAIVSVEGEDAVPSGDDIAIGFLATAARSKLVDVRECPIATAEINAALPRRRAELVGQLVADGVPERARQGSLLFRHAVEAGRVVTEPSEVVTAEVEGIEMSFRAGDFFQNNPFILPSLVKHVVGGARGHPPSSGTGTGGGADVDFLIDTYSGSGLFALCAARHFEQCIGVETFASAVRNARANAARNGLSNVQFVEGSAEQIFDAIDEQFVPARSAVVVDPPRKGCDLAFLRQLVDYAPRRIVYVSCSPDTQARDLKLLIGAGYALRCLQPFDLFPQTRHVEAVATLEWPEADQCPSPTPLDVAQEGSARGTPRRYKRNDGRGRKRRSKRPRR